MVETIGRQKAQTDLWPGNLTFGFWVMRDLVSQMQILPQNLTGPLSGALPGIEFVLGICLVVGFMPRASAMVSTFVFSLFAVVMFVLIQKDAPQMCGCFGPGSEYAVDWNHFLIDLSWLFCSVSLLLLPSNPASSSKDQLNYSKA